MNRSWVFDSSALIALGKIDRLDLITGLPGVFHVPHAVKKEILSRKPPDPASLWPLDKNCPARVVRTPLDRAVLSWDLGAGESETICHCLRHRGCVAVLDDRMGRRCAKAMGVQVKGTVGLLLWLKEQGKLDKIKPVLGSLSKSGFHLDPAVFKLALKLAGEHESGLGGEYSLTAHEAPAVYKTTTSKKPQTRRPQRKRK